ncbi:hypothetical protein [Streptomyces sp. H27-C3]|uniref:hypothetical protein n=1 Tax=Streptomyces sp. H27-C3 TaxID=3046305 RepID=UPI0024B9253E|nr:hypothetical protein [Streptomyces sp. H27-C3]MDJ0462891.1 hypothetical protein [Streptomyces sp. H27-C3]
MRYEAERENDPKSQPQTPPRPDGQGAVPRSSGQGRGTGVGQEGQGAELRPDEQQGSGLRPGERGDGLKPEGPGRDAGLRPKVPVPDAGRGPQGQDGAPSAAPGRSVGEPDRAHRPSESHRPTESHQPDRSPAAGTESTIGRLLPQGEREKIGLRLQQTVNTFVDGPRRSVEEADSLLEETARQLTDTLAERRRTLRTTWADEGRQAETEELRVALRTYRELTDRLLQL